MPPLVVALLVGLGAAAITAIPLAVFLWRLKQQVAEAEEANDPRMLPEIFQRGLSNQGLPPSEWIERVLNSPAIARTPVFVGAIAGTIGLASAVLWFLQTASGG